MLEALRGLGYSTATALADIIDNSIAAEASQVAIQFFWNSRSSTVAILDDGAGMTEPELDAAMRLGQRSPLEVREKGDLGRFGLGLKTASFSQCRRLTVASRKVGATSCLRWDLDVLTHSDDDGWHLLEGPAEGSSAIFGFLEGREHGTVVLWENLDRIITGGFTEQDFLDLMDQVERHLAMVFHRFLEGSHPRLRITINGRSINPWNPFLVSHPATWSSPVERFETDAGTVEVQCHVLPHRDRLDPREHERAGGPEGWTAQQGFYVYRNQRLLVAGSWLGLGQGRCWTKEEAHRLARIRLDIPNSADAEWKIDIRKATAKPPVSLKARLTRLAEDTRSRARRVFAHRGQAVSVRGQGAIAQAWRAEHCKGGIRYRIDVDHPVIKGVLDEAGSLRPQIQAMLRVIEETVPVQRIWLDTTEGKEVPRTGFSGDAPAEVLSILEVMYRNMVERKGILPRMAKDLLLRTEPFHDYPELVMALPENPGQ
uniref:ATP-binding protein n=1 Tax=Geobacter metallireducens TaxID=28232 RepID=A0A831XLN5_GEOME